MQSIDGMLDGGLRTPAYVIRFSCGHVRVTPGPGTFLVETPEG